MLLLLLLVGIMHARKSCDLNSAHMSSPGWKSKICAHARPKSGSHRSKQTKHTEKSWLAVEIKNKYKVIKSARYGSNGTMILLCRVICDIVRECNPGPFLSASLYVSKRGAYWDRLCRDVVGCLSRACTVCGQSINQSINQRSDGCRHWSASVSVSWM